MRRGTTRACPGLTGKRSATAKAEPFAASHSETGIARNGEPLSGILTPIRLQVGGQLTLPELGKTYISGPGHRRLMVYDGQITDQLVAYHQARAEGGADLIVVQVESARYASHVLMATDDSCLPGYARLAENVHAHGTMLCGQLLHPGRDRGHLARGSHFPLTRLSSLGLAQVTFLYAEQRAWVDLACCSFGAPVPRAGHGQAWNTASRCHSRNSRLGRSARRSGSSMTWPALA
ncbi:MAG: hypothetical protein ACM3ML_10190 [Micromonosporaceae bacterium]